MSSTISTNQMKFLQYVVGNKATILTTGVIKLHHASKQEKKWVYTDLCGALCLIMDRELGGIAMFRMFDLNSYEMVFETELYYDFDKYYYELNDYFYCFEIPGGFMIGFSFADSNEAAKFKNEISRYSPKTDILVHIGERTRRRAGIITVSPNLGGTRTGGSKDKSPFYKKIFKKNNNNSKKPFATDNNNNNDNNTESHEYDLGEHYQNLKVSRPQNFVHENHIGWDAKNQCFDLSQLSKELKNIFKNAGIRKKDLQNTDTALIIADAILNQPVPEKNSRNKKGKKALDPSANEAYITSLPSEGKEKQVMNTERRMSNLPGLVVSPMKPPPLNLGKPIEPPPALNLNAKPPGGTMGLSGPKPPDMLKFNPGLGSQDQKKFQEKRPSLLTIPNRGNLLEEIRQGVKLKPVTAADKSSGLKMTKQQEISLTSKLAIAINKRREDLTKNDVSSEEDDNNWSDSD